MVVVIVLVIAMMAVIVVATFSALQKSYEVHTTFLTMWW
jgi:hypothetical protein